MKRKRKTRFTPIQKVEPVGCMVAGDRRKMVEAHLQAMKQEAEAWAAIQQGALQVLKAVQWLFVKA